MQGLFIYRLPESFSILIGRCQQEVELPGPAWKRTFHMPQACAQPAQPRPTGRPWIGRAWPSGDITPGDHTKKLYQQG